MSTEGPIGNRYEIMIEEQTHPWGRSTISTPEIRTLGRLPDDCAVVAVDLSDGSERELDESDVHELPPLEPGKDIAKRMNFKRGS
ncbi:MAG TPA: hypothetical protein VNT54_07775 [Solirubrobacteraceae bacterium]|jgi:hypothetical protein|nr:hypothetical protein [Solirubrobacteraceae bacterium]